MKYEKLSIPYMGSKRKIAEGLFDVMLQVKPRAKYFYDLFGGGGAMSFHALQRGMEVVYNDKDTDMAALMDFLIGRIRNGDRSKYGLLPEDWYRFITREDFDEIKKQTGAYAQFVRICYSFGNHCQSYRYGKEIQDFQKNYHNTVIYGDLNSFRSMNTFVGGTLTYPNFNTPHDRRMSLVSQLGRLNKTKGKSLGYKRLDCAQSLQSMQRIGDINRINCDLNLQTRKGPFDKVVISTPFDETIVYLDPPYIGTMGVSTYKEQCSHESLYDYMRNSKYTCFLSEYTAPFEFIYTKNVPKFIPQKKQATERLFINRYPDDYNPQPTQGSLLDLSIKK